MAQDEPACGGCGKTLESASGGVVVAFGNALWHVECFRCAKCHNTVSADTNLLLLADGSPVCQSCSYSCHVCHNPILDEAIMTGDDSYHASCFKCRTCGRRIEELVFAKTSQGIYCMACHNDRVARSRRHADKKRSRTKSRKEDSAPQSRATDYTPSPRPAEPSPALNAPQDLGKRRKSYDDGVRPLDSFFGPKSFASQQSGAPGSSVSTPGGLSPSLEVPTSRADKRRSINPGYRPRGDSVGTEALNGRLSPYSMEDLRGSVSSRAPSPSFSLRSQPVPDQRGREPSRADSIDNRRAPSTDSRNRAPSADTRPPPPDARRTDTQGSTDVRHTDPNYIPYDEDLILGDEIDTVILGPSEGEITMLFEEPSFVLDEPTVTVEPNGRSATNGDGRSATNGLGDGRNGTNGLGNGRSRSPSIGRSASPAARSAASPAPPPPSLGGAPPSLASPAPPSRGPSPFRAPSPTRGLNATSPPAGAGFARSVSPAPLSARSPSPGRSASPLVVKSASQGVPIKRTASPAISKSASQGATSPPSSMRPVGKVNGTTQFPSMNGSPAARKKGSRDSYPPPAVPPKDGAHHQHSMSLHSNLLAQVTQPPSITQTSLSNQTTPTPSISQTAPSTQTTPSRPIPVRSSSSSSSSPVIESTATYGAMQLPPMRFSLSDTDFADLLKGVGVESTKLRMSLDGRPVLDGAKEDKTREDKVQLEKARAEEKARLEEKARQEQKAKEEKAREEKAKEEKAREEKARAEEKVRLVDGDKARSGAEAEPERPRPSIESIAREVLPRISSDARPSFSSSTDMTFVSIPDGLGSATASILDDDEEEFGRDTTLATPVIRTTLAPNHGSTSSMSGSGSNGPYLSAARDRLDSAASLSAASDAIVRRLREMSENAQERGSTSVKINLEFLEAITKAVVGSKEKYTDLKGRYDGMKRTSQQFIDGLSVAQSEYDKELAARRDAEAEVTRLRVQLSGQAARLTALTAETRIREVSDQQLADANVTLRALLRDVAKLRTERDMIVAEIDELGKKSFSSSGEGWEPLETRLENVRKQYRKDLEGLKLQREGLVKEITELKEHRDIFLEETTALNARNEELAELNAQIQRQVEQISNSPRPPLPHMGSSGAVPTQLSLGTVSSSLKEFGVKRPGPSAPSASVSSMGTTTSMNSAATASTSTVSAIEEKEREEVKIVRVQTEEPVSTTSSGKGGFRFFKAPKPPKDWSAPSNSAKAAAAAAAQSERPKGFKEHHFTQQSVLRFARCDHCGDKMWGMQMRCSNCNIACHQRCVYLVKSSCQSSSAADEEPVVDISPLPPSMFGRDLIEQVRADAQKDPNRVVPVIVDKCIRAVEASAMDYEGIYRKTGGSSQSKAITQLFERGDYDSFNLEDTDSFNDISSITSVMKTYFRQLPNPLLTFALHEKFVEAAAIRDPAAKHEALVSLVRQLPAEHYHTLRYLMLHLSRVKDCSEENLMSARNIGVVFGPTLMRSADPSREFGDMAGKALTIEWLVDNAPTVFSDPPPS